MSITVINSSPYLRTSREYPQDDPHQLSVEVNKSYVDIAGAVNNRTIGLYPTTMPAITGNSYFLKSNTKQQSFRQVYSFTSTSAIPHGINFSNIDRIINAYGSFTNALVGGNWYGLVFDNFNVIAGQVGFYLDPMNINFTVGAVSPIPVKGTIVIEWLSLA